MPDFWEVTHARAQQTNAVWSTFNPSYKVETLDLATHQANTALLFQQADDVEPAKDAHDTALDVRDANLALIHTLNVNVPQLIRSNLGKKELLRKEVKDVLAVDLGSIPKELKRARRLKSLWTRVNAQRAGMTPALPELDRSGKTVADLTAAISSHEGLLQDIEDKQSLWSEAKSALEATDAIVDDGNKRWYEGWKSYYDEGSPEHNALSQIEAEGGTSPPTALEIDTLVGNGLNVDVTYVAGGGAHATTLTLLWQVEGVDPGFDHSAAVILAGQSIGPFEMDQTINVKTQAANSVATVDSAVQQTAIV